MEKPPRESLINFERTWKKAICTNPECGFSYDTNEVGNINCPKCGAIMYAQLKKTPLSIAKEK